MKSETDQTIPNVEGHPEADDSSAPETPRADAAATARRGPLDVVIGALGRGGTERHLAQVLPRLAALGWQPRVHTLTALGPVADELAAAGVPAATVGSAARLARWPRWLRRSAGIPITAASLRQRLAGPPGRVVWTLLPEAYLLTMAALATLPGAPPVVMSRRSLNAYQARLPGVRTIERALHRRTAGILGNAEAVRRQLIEDEGVPPDHVQVIANGIELERFDRPVDRRAVRAALEVPDDHLVLVVVANLIAYKGHADLLAALGRIRDRLPPFTLLCAGGGASDGLAAAAREHGVEGRVRWLGSRSDVPDLLAASDLAVLPSHEEGSSNAVLEYMAARLPVIATRVGGNPEAVVEGETGHLVAARAPAELAAAIESVAARPDRGRALGLAGRARVETTFDMDACAARYDACFAGILSRAEGAAR